MAKRKLITSVEACKLMGDMPIDYFLKLEKDNVIPPPIMVGIGRRWDKDELWEWYIDQPIRIVINP